MYIDKSLLKNRSKQLMITTLPRPLTVALIFVLISVLMNFLQSKLLSVNMPESVINRYLEAFYDGNMENALYYLQSMAPPDTAYIICLVITAAMEIVRAGLNIYLLNAYNGKEPCYGNLLDGFGIAGRVILLSVLKYIIIGLWSLLLIIPGIVAAYRYRLATYLLIDRPELSVLDCLRTSRKLMKGHKWELLGLDISFIGWYILGAIPYIGNAVAMFSLPYLGFSYIGYYYALQGKDYGPVENYSTRV